MELQNGMCAWLAVRAIEEEDDEDDDEAAGGGASHEEAGDEQLGRLNTWMGQQDERANWMYDHIVRQFQYMSTHDNLDLHLQIDPFPKREAEYPPYGYTSHMPLAMSTDWALLLVVLSDYALLSSDLTYKIACRKFLIKNEEEIFTDVGDGVKIYPDNVASPAI
ncbi:hypothetical protein Tco_0813030 [Tanacetum coccineum]